jgi:hypothetical protein
MTGTFRSVAPPPSVGNALRATSFLVHFCRSAGLTLAVLGRGEAFTAFTRQRIPGRSDSMLRHCQRIIERVMIVVAASGGSCSSSRHGTNAVPP